MSDALLCQGLLQKDHELLVTQLSSLYALKEQAFIRSCSAPCLVQTCNALLILYNCSMHFSPPQQAPWKVVRSDNPFQQEKSVIVTEVGNSTRAGLTDEAA